MYAACFKGKNYGPGSTVPGTENEKEYERFLHIVPLIRLGLESPEWRSSNLIGNIDVDYVEKRFLGSHDHYLMREENLAEGSSDLAIVRDDVIICLDHFRTDASKECFKQGKSKGTAFQMLLGELSHEYGNELSAKLVEEEIERQDVRFCTEDLLNNIKRKMLDKSDKIVSYEAAINRYIEDNGCREDLEKPIEHWFFIEDVSPTTGFQFVSRNLQEVLESLPKITGLIYAHDSAPFEMPFNQTDISILVPG